MHVACRYGQTSTAQFLTTLHISVDAQDKNLETALHISAWNGHARIAQVLLKAGANKLIKNEVTTILSAVDSVESTVPESKLYSEHESPRHTPEFNPIIAGGRDCSTHCELPRQPRLRALPPGLEQVRHRRPRQVGQHSAAPLREAALHAGRHATAPRRRRVRPKKLRKYELQELDSCFC